MRRSSQRVSVSSRFFPMQPSGHLSRLNGAPVLDRSLAREGATPAYLLLLFPFGAFLQLDQFKLRHSLPTYVAKSSKATLTFCFASSFFFSELSSFYQEMVFCICYLGLKFSEIFVLYKFCATKFFRPKVSFFCFVN